MGDAEGCGEGLDIGDGVGMGDGRKMGASDALFGISIGGILRFFIFGSSLSSLARWVVINAIKNVPKAMTIPINATSKMLPLCF